MSIFSKNIYIYITLILYPFFLSAQNNANESSEVIPKTIIATEPDSVLNKIFEKIFYKTVSNRWGNSVAVANQAIKTFRQKENYKLVAEWHNRLGFLYQQHDIYTLALDIYYSSLKYTKNLPEERAEIYNNIARVYQALSFDLQHAEQYLLNSLKIQQKITDSSKRKFLQARSYNQLGIIFERKNKFNKAKEYYFKALKLRKELNNIDELSNSYFTIGYFYNFTGKEDSALFYFNKGYKIVKDPNLQISYLLQQARIYGKQENFAQALKNIEQAEQIAENKYNQALSRIFKAKSEVFDYMGKTNEAILWAEQALTEADNYNQSYLKLSLYPLIISYYKKLGDYKKASNYQETYLNIFKRKNREKDKIVQQYILQKEDKIISQLEADREKLERSNRIMYFSIAGLLILLVISIFLAVYYFKHKQQLNKNSLEIKTQAIIAKILRNITGKERNIEKFLQDALEVILDIPWLRFETKGAVFLTTKEGYLKMVAHKNLGKPLLEMCATVKSGECLCGKVLKYKKTLHCDHVGEQHDFRPEGMTPHGHYNIPFLFQGKVLGVLTLYLKHGHKKQEYEVKFLETIAATISSVINRKTIQEKLRLQAIEQEKLNQKLFAQKLELEQRNLEIQQYSKQQDALNQKFFAQTLELDQRNTEIQQYSKKLEEQKKQIEEAHKDVTDSITYAQTIQEALLPKPEQLDQLFDDYFVIYLPKQVVSGDFYYAQKVGDKLIFTVADCTGHGVPGGFITMLGITFISELIHHKEIKNSAQILEILRTNIKGIFAEFGSKNTNGFDISLCVVDTKTNILSYAGAYNPLYIVRKGELIEYKGTKNPIGWHPKEMPFEDNEIQLQNNDKLYLFTDGYYDQIGENKKKFLRKRFKMLLTEISDLPMKEQKRLLKGIFDKWKGNEHQTDDVTVMGINWKV